MIGEIQVQDIKARLPLFHPLGRRTVIGESRPHVLHLRREAEGERHGTNRFDLKIGQCAGAIGGVLGRKEDLADGEIRVRKRNDRVPRLYVDGGDLLIHVDGHGVVLHLRRNPHMAKNFPGEDPGLERSILLA